MAWLERSDVDVLAMQETKCKDDQFPHEAFEELGYQVAHHGLSQWNGVAVASRVGLEDVRLGFDDMPGFHKDPEVSQDPEARVAGAVDDLTLTFRGIPDEVTRGVLPFMLAEFAMMFLMVATSQQEQLQ